MLRLPAAGVVVGYVGRVTLRANMTAWPRIGYRLMTCSSFPPRGQVYALSSPWRCAMSSMSEKKGEEEKGGVDPKLQADEHQEQEEQEDEDDVEEFDYDEEKGYLIYEV